MKTYEYKVYTKAGSYLTTWVDVHSEPEFNQEINSSGGELVVTLARNVGDYGEGTDIDFGYNVKIYCFDDDGEEIIFNGYIANYTPVYSENKVDVTLLSYGDDLGKFMLQSSIANAGSIIESASQLRAFEDNAYLPQAYIGTDAFNPSIEYYYQKKFTAPSGLTSIAAIDVTVDNWNDITSSLIPFDLILEVYSDNSNSPGTLLGSTTLPAGSERGEIIPYTSLYTYGAVPTIPPRFMRFNFNTAIPADEGVSYWFRLRCPGSSYRETKAIFSDVIVLWHRSDFSIPFQVWNGDGSTEVEYLSQDPSDMLRDIIDKYRSVGGVLNYDANSIEDTNTTVSYKFSTNTVLEAINKCLDLAPSGWYWYVDYSTNLVHFHPESSTPDHVFGLEKDIYDLVIEKRIEDLVNTIYFTGGIPDAQTDNLYKQYSNQNSIAKYGIKAMKYIDQRVTLAATAETISNAILEKRSEPELRTTISIVDSSGGGYDIESIRVGDVIAVRNVSQTVGLSTWDVSRWDEDYWDFNIKNLSSIQMQIQKIKYTPDIMEIYASTIAPDVSKRIEDINRNLETIQTLNNSSAPQ
jgi:hypothetical protein